MNEFKAIDKGCTYQVRTGSAPAPTLREAAADKIMAAVLEFGEKCATHGMPDSDGKDCAYIRPMLTALAAAPAAVAQAEPAIAPIDERGRMIYKLAVKLIDSALDSDASGRPEASMADTAMALKHLIEELPLAQAEPVAAVGEPALVRFSRVWQAADDGTDPVERLRAFCSMAMSGQDWLDAEPFFDALASPPPPERAAPELDHVECSDCGTYFHCLCGSNVPELIFKPAQHAAARGE